MRFRFWHDKRHSNLETKYIDRAYKEAGKGGGKLLKRAWDLQRADKARKK